MANIGIVLSGGMVKGAYQIGVLKALSEYVSYNHIKVISASSIGALNGYALSTKKLSYAEDMWSNVRFEGSRAFVGSILKRQYIQNIIDNMYSEEDIIQPALCVPYFNVSKFKLEYINLKHVDKKNIVRFLKASIALPTINKAVEIEGTKYYDGALIDNIPVHPLTNYKVDYILCVYFDNYNYTFENEVFDKHIIKINFSDDKILKNSVFAHQNQIQNMIKTGYEKSGILFDSIFKNGPDDLDYIYNKIGYINSFNITKRNNLRITGDIAVNNINKIMKKLVSRHIKM